jgi:hypothetical protein
MQVQHLIMAIPQRRYQAEKLASAIRTTIVEPWYLEPIIVYDAGWLSPAGTGMACLSIASKMLSDEDWVVILEDDCTTAEYYADALRDILINLTQAEQDLAMLTSLGRGWINRAANLKKPMGSYIVMPLVIGTQGLVIRGRLLKDILGSYRGAPMFKRDDSQEQSECREFDGAINFYLGVHGGSVAYVYPAIVSHLHKDRWRDDKKMDPVMDLTSTTFLPVAAPIYGPMTEDNTYREYMPPLPDSRSRHKVMLTTGRSIVMPGDTSIKVETFEDRRPQWMKDGKSGPEG